MNISSLREGGVTGQPAKRNLPDIGRYGRLVTRGILTPAGLAEVLRESEEQGVFPEQLLLKRGVRKHELLFSISEYYNLPFVEYDEGVVSSQKILRPIKFEKLKAALWFPLAVYENRAEVIAYRPEDPGTVQDIKNTLGVSRIDFLVALPQDLVRIIENNYDLNPGFPFAGGRTPLAKVRTYLSMRRSLYAQDRTLLAKGRTGLAFIRTGVSFLTISLLFLRIFGAGKWLFFETPLLIAGIYMVYDGLKWYLPTRKVGKREVECINSEPTQGTSALEAYNECAFPRFRRSETVEGAAELRAGWDKLSPVMRRRFLACDRSDLAADRTDLASHRTLLAKARTGLAFTRTGVAFIGLGTALIRYFHPSTWTMLDASLITVGLLMSIEGFHWYFGGRPGGTEGLRSALKAELMDHIWNSIIPPRHRRSGPKKDERLCPVHPSHMPGIWATTGHATERTLLCERRSAMAKLRTVMARARTGMSFIRTGTSVSAVGAGLLVYFGTGSLWWTVFDIVLIIAGAGFMADGFLWKVPAEQLRMQFPYCFGDFDIVIPDYGRPACTWRKAVFNHEDI
ncbi:MAG: hypothetical protein M0Z59_03990 [Nitrospiraceae bacterium]|nr:hypothetical protein [Nitrospiraceae bacterium]